MSKPARAIIIMGVSGSGKTTVGARLADALGWAFFEGDDFHPARNVAKMAGGIPLDDADRAPWLNRLQRLIADQLSSGQSLVLACSALKESYRQRLCRGHSARVLFVFLDGDYDLILKHMQSRRGHYMPVVLLRHQFEVLEIPHDALRLPVDQPILDIVNSILVSVGEKQ